MIVNWFDYVMLLLQGSSVAITAGLLLFGIPPLREQLLSYKTFHPKQLLIILLFSLFAIYGTHAGKAISISGNLAPVTWSLNLQSNQAIINFRDMIVVTVGLISGPWAGLMVGSIAGLERYFLGGFTALPCAIMSLSSGLLAGLVRHYSTNMVPPYKAAIIGATVIILQMLLILLLAKPFSDAYLLVQHTGIPMLITTSIGCYAFQQVMRGLDKIHLQLETRETKIRAQRAEIRALNAKIEPHFIMNTLNSIKALIRIDQDKARHYVCLLGDFLHETRDYASQDTITIKTELLHVKKYIDFQLLRFPTTIDFQVHTKPTSLLEFSIPPRSILTLIENSLIHGFKQKKQSKKITIHIFLKDKRLIISVEDNGAGITKQDINKLGNNPINSSHKNGGHGLYDLKNSLRKYYGKESDLSINFFPDRNKTVVKLIFPIHINSIEAYK
jgi:two-component system, LytTR family, sensor kinase